MSPKNILFVILYTYNFDDVSLIKQAKTHKQKEQAQTVPALSVFGELYLFAGKE
jgi:hypothetical protein